MSLNGKGPLGLKGDAVTDDKAYLNSVRDCACYVCGKPGPSEAHHCRDTPDFNERDIYTRLPSASRRSGDHDAIPLCQEHHKMFHLERTAFHLQFGKDYRLLPYFRALMETQNTVDF